MSAYRMPAEWEPHRATWLSWPHNPDTWPGKFAAMLPAYVQMVAALACSEPVYINVNNATMEAEARVHLREAVARGDIRFHHIATNDAWIRDHGAIFVHTSDPATPATPPSLTAVNWEYNAWGGKYPPYDLDNQVAARMAQVLGVDVCDGGMVLEGGSVDVNGQGVLLTTEACLLNPNRNPHLSRAAIEQHLQDWLGVHTILWLGDGIVGDDTDGHVDDLTRFVSPDTVVTAVEDDPADMNYAPLRENLRRLHTMREQYGIPRHIVELPMPPAVVYEGERLPASYANFYIANHVLLLPCFDHPRDQQAQQILQQCFPTREIVGINCTDLVWGLGAFHCLTQQVPA